MPTIPMLVLVTDYTKYTIENTDISSRVLSFQSNGLYFVKMVDWFHIYTSKLTFPYHQTITKKIDPELVDMEWYAGKTDANEIVKLPEKYLPDTISLPDMSRYATKDELAALTAQISAINIALQNRLEGVE